MTNMVERLAHAARELQDEPDAQQTMEKVVEIARELVPDAEQAAISLIHRDNRIDTPAASSDVVVRVDELQYETDEGPCLDAIRVQETVRSDDIGTDDRWPSWGPRAAEETGVRSMMCFRLFTLEDTVGGLNLYSGTVGAFDETDFENGQVLAAHSAVAVARAQQVANLKVAMDTRTVIGQAQGILMERYGVDAERAFQVLRRVSSHVKLRDVALELVTTRRTPGAIAR